MVQYNPYFWAIIIPCLGGIVVLAINLLNGSTHFPIDSVKLARIQLSQEAYERRQTLPGMAYNRYDLKLLAICPAKVKGTLPSGDNMNTEFLPIRNAFMQCYNYSLDFWFDAQKGLRLPSDCVSTYNHKIKSPTKVAGTLSVVALVCYILALIISAFKFLRRPDLELKDSSLIIWLLPSLLLPASVLASVAFAFSQKIPKVLSSMFQNCSEEMILLEGSSSGYLALGILSFLFGYIALICATALCVFWRKFSLKRFPRGIDTYYNYYNVYTADMKARRRERMVSGHYGGGTSGTGGTSFSFFGFGGGGDTSGGGGFCDGGGGGGGGGDGGGCS